MAASVVHLDVEISPRRIEDDFHNILAEIRVFWQKKHVIYEPIDMEYNTGFFNEMIQCFNEIDPRDLIMIRLYNGRVKFIIDREMEIASIKCFMKLGCAPKILATFNNGFCYEFVKGEILNCNRLGEEPIWRHIAEGFAKFHAEKMEDFAHKKKVNQIDRFVDESLKKFPKEFKNLNKNAILKEILPTKLKLEAELNWIRDQCKKLKSPIVLCHNDTRGENVIWNEKTGSVTFIDFECAGFNYQAFEIAAHFANYCGFYPADFSLYPVKEFQLRWLRYYLEKYNELMRLKIKITSTDVCGLYVQVSKCYLLHLISWATVSITLDSMDIADDENFSFIDYAVANLKQYYKEKDKIMRMKIPE